jgi:hypothetical protein
MIADTVSKADVDKKLAPFKALAISAPHAVFAQNQVTNTVLQVLKSTRQQTVRLSPLTTPTRSSVSADAIISTMSRRSFANYTDGG